MWQSGKNLRQEKSIDAVEGEGVPSLVFVVNDWIDAVSNGQGEQGHTQIFKGHSVKLFGARLLIRAFVLEHQPGKNPHDRILGVDGEIDDFVNFPDFNGKADETWDFDQSVGLVVQDVQEDNDGLEYIKKDRPHR